jgi:DNA helicase II / ATP-dependent DNA helicase PcrA
MINFLDELNPQQRAAVEQTEGSLLILAGAGSGKTRVITYRIAYLIEALGVAPGNILAVTFTNKAAAQMKDRVAALLERRQIGGQDERKVSGIASDPLNGGANRNGLSIRAEWNPTDQALSGEPLLASTFLEMRDPSSETNAASRERTARRAESAHISTFHSLCVSILRRNIDRLGYSRDFSIYDDDDQLRIAKTCIKELGLALQIPSPRGALSEISYAKNRGLSPEELYQQARKEETAKIALVYDLYQRKLRQANALDFDDLLLKAAALFHQAPDVCEIYNRRFRYVLVDEYQDTNRIQYQLIRQMTLLQQNLCVVGDEDQSIYRWRGADVGNILKFEEDYPNTTVIRLEQNYRPTQILLDAAGAVVRNNEARKGKTLWTERGAGQRIGLFEARDADEEGWFVATQIAGELSASPDATIGVLYRTNAQARIREEAMRRQRIEYRMVGGFSFYGRAEIKDILAYARFASNLHDSAAFGRILNSPARGIGEATLSGIEESARRQKLSSWEALEHELAGNTLPSRAVKALEKFRQLIQELVEDRARMRMGEFFRSILVRSGYVRALEAEETPEAEGRIENLRELVNAAEAAEASGETLAEFLDRAALVSDADTYDPNARVTLMTLHTAKGLEFSAVFMVGMEEGLFPHKFSARDQEDIEEERRLCYVGMTRAKNRLVLSCARSRRSFAAESFDGQRPSRFLQEVPQELIEHVNWRAFSAKPRTSWDNALNSASDVNRFVKERAAGQTRRRSGLTFAPRPSGTGQRWKLGSQVRHPKYGLGTVIACDGDGESAKVTVSFAGYGTKKLVERYALLEQA